MTRRRQGVLLGGMTAGSHRSKSSGVVAPAQSDLSSPSQILLMQAVLIRGVERQCMHKWSCTLANELLLAINVVGGALPQPCQWNVGCRFSRRPGGDQ